MSLAVEARHCGAVYVIRCKGRIVAGEQAQALEDALHHGLREFQRVTLHVGDVSRVDSMGMGLMVRFLTHTRARGGDFRLAEVPPFFLNLLRVTKLAGIFRIYDSEEEAIVSFLKEGALPSASSASVGPTVLFLDQSPDLCAFVRALLHHHGYAVSSTCRLRDAKTLLTAAKFDYIVVGPDSSQHSSETAAATLKALALTSATVQLKPEFKHDDPEQAGLELLRAMQAAARS
jgi:anti-sigma B factor antagonist